MNIQLGRIGSLVILAIGLTACEASEQAGGPVEARSAIESADAGLSGADTPVQKAREIDWTAARQARIEAINKGQSADAVIAQAAGNASLSPVPVMLPSGIVMPANEKQTVAFTSDGYFASYPGAKYDIIVNGTNEVFDTKDPNASDDERLNMAFNAMEAGAQVAFSRFGADYLVEFECNIIDSDAGCITEDEAFNVVNGLFVAVAE